MLYWILSVRHTQVPVFDDLKGFEDETVRIVVAPVWIEQAAFCHKAAFRNAFLADNQLPCVCHDLIGVHVEVARHAVNLHTLVDTGWNDTVVVSLLRQIPVTGIK